MWGFFNGEYTMLKETLSALSLVLAISGVSVASDATPAAATKESCEAAIAAAETHAGTVTDADAKTHQEDHITKAKAALEKADFAACAEALHEHHDHAAETQEAAH